MKKASDFCCISLSARQNSFSVVENRISAQGRVAVTYTVDQDKGMKCFI